MDNSSQILETIRHNISGWNPIVAEIDLLGQTLNDSIVYINESRKENDLNNIVAIIEKVQYY
jgi:hypothetical protein